ncbi:MAG: glycosyltransferase family 4 protein [candidate division KSB1 bacterium]|nr:glycosyltransferase family 4 protein [candidate division KSB1 bacterium]MDZ7275968.1 glycosyltransferase family 4 protein [candidate division KSB1 bacterium]MDZ7285750.1 glycosyltransferase family 4 protein [candidate division KSB1 bacterium]MDZ7298782.1 glycosyltransferase family 4 protein [candidate division KSB1 bacterium]MDZ7307928.1 glycosyltransferase family 4 protein [candidate division KSB1 bacterium]
MVITYFSYLWDIEGISAGSAIKAREFLAAMERLGHTTHLHWRVPQPAPHANVAQRAKERLLKPLLQKYLHEPKRLLRNAKYLWQEQRILTRERPDILLNRLELYTFSALWLARRLGLPLVIEADCPPTHEHMNFYGKEFLHLGNLPMQIEMANLRGADAIIAISNILANYYIERGIAREKIHVIPNAVDAGKFVPRPKDQALLRELGLENRTVIGWVGSLYGWSGIENLIGMARHLLAHRPQVSFLLVGGGKNKEFFQQQLHTNGYAPRVVLPGTVPHSEVPRYLSCMDIVLAPYPKLDFWYPSSVKLFEYMASGKATVATRVGQVAEIIEEGKNGLLFDPARPGELTEKVLALVDSEEKRRQLGEQARRDVLAKWTWEHMARRMLAVFEEVLQRRRRPAGRR